MEDREILLVEDNPDDEELTVRALRKANLMNRITVVRDGAQAIDRLLGAGRSQGLPVVVLLDLKLPKVDGLDVLRRIRSDERTRLLPVVVFTSSSEERDIVESYNLGANGYVRKPVSFDEFTQAV